MNRVRIPEISEPDWKAMEARSNAQVEHMNRLRPALERRWLADCGFHEVHMDARDELVPEVLRKWWFPRGGALLCGPVGTGKSAAACWVARRLHREGGWDHPDFPTAVVPVGQAVMMPAIDLIQAALNGKTLRFRQRLLVIEDWQPSYPASQSRGVDALMELIDRRWGGDTRYATIVTTNARPQEFQRSFAPAWSRLTDKRGPGLVVMGGSDRRSA